MRSTCACAAALVIQGSACVYSRKVEYLHTLVLQALAYVADKKCACWRHAFGAEVSGHACMEAALCVCKQQNCKVS